MPNPAIKSLAFREDYNSLVHELKTKVVLFPVSARPPNISITINAIWDTGATHSVITPEVAQALHLLPIDTVNIIGVNNEKPEPKPVSIVHVVLPNSVILNTARVTIATIGGGANMLIGMDIISHGDFLISNADGKTTFSFVIPPFPEKQDWIELSNKINISNNL